MAATNLFRRETRLQSGRAYRKTGHRPTRCCPGPEPDTNRHRLLASDSHSSNQPEIRCDILASGPGSFFSRNESELLARLTMDWYRVVGGGRPCGDS